MFDAAIHVLKGELLCGSPGNEDWDKESEKWERWVMAHPQADWQALILAAIRVLEAAAKVDKKMAMLYALPEGWDEMSRDGFAAIRALLAALPDAPKEEK